MSTKHGGPAFPATVTRDDGWPAYEVSGMSLRDYFAAKAMAAIIADVTQNSPEGFPTTEDAGTDNAQETCYSTVAADAYAMADAMLAAREAK